MTPHLDPIQVVVRPSGAPAAELPHGMVADVSKVLEAHGLDAPTMALVSALAEVIDRTPVGQGGTAEVPS